MTRAARGAVVPLIASPAGGPPSVVRGDSGPPGPDRPAELTSFVGRAAELTALHAVLDGHRLVTVTGAGGVGKTRLARRVAAGRGARATDDVRWVDLGSVTAPDRVPRAVADDAVHAGPAGDPVAALTAHLAGTRTLVCLDTCEHLRDACAALAGELLRHCPDVAVLATSRERLGVPGERVWRVPPLAPDDAVRLFTERAALMGHAVAVSERPAVSAICRLLDGVPLAVELAAAWTRVLSPREIRARLDDRLPLLVDGPRGGPDRHRTMAASIGWSHALLDPADRALLHGLSVFAGEFTAEAAVAACGDGTLTGLARLVDASLVEVRTRRVARFRLPGPVREYAAGERTAERAAVPGWDGLTRAEREVVELVGDGLSNPQIGARLFMSRSTVKTHLAHVFAKLGVTNRVELATAVARCAAPDRRPPPAARRPGVSG